MCDACGCGLHSHGEAQSEEDRKNVEIMKNLLHENDHEAAHNRAHFDEHGVLAINLMSSPGSGKTALLEATIEALKDKYRIGVIEGDLETENDAARIRAKGVPAVQITTGTACHLDAVHVHKALHQLGYEDLDIVFIENVGNLVCPATFDLGQHASVALLSVTEGHDKPAKYPVMFHCVDLVLISKTDLLAFIDDFDPEYAKNCVKELSNDAAILEVSAKKPESLAGWIDWLEKMVEKNKKKA